MQNLIEFTLNLLPVAAVSKKVVSTCFNRCGPLPSQENHAHFQVPSFGAVSKPSVSSVNETILGELRDLRRDGVKATSPSDSGCG